VHELRVDYCIVQHLREEFRAIGQRVDEILNLPESRIENFIGLLVHDVLVGITIEQHVVVLVSIELPTLQLLVPQQGLEVGKQGFIHCVNTLVPCIGLYDHGKQYLVIVSCRKSAVVPKVSTSRG
jgi:hypothetical protein